jgi:hypothetical protein
VVRLAGHYHQRLLHDCAQRPRACSLRVDLAARDRQAPGAIRVSCAPISRIAFCRSKLARTRIS